jgi:hypothetical protein
MLAELLGAVVRALWTLAFVAAALFALLVAKKTAWFVYHAFRMRGQPAHAVRCRLGLLVSDRHSISRIILRYREYGSLRLTYFFERLLEFGYLFAGVSIVATVGAVLFGATPLVWAGWAGTIIIAAGCLWGLRKGFASERRLRDPDERYTLAERYSTAADSEPLFPWPVGPEAVVDDDAPDPGASYADAATRWEPTHPAWAPLWVVDSQSAGEEES